MTVQAYYTKSDLATCITGLIGKTHYQLRNKTVLDLGCGTGNLTQALHSHFKGEDRARVHLVEPDPAALPKLTKRRKLGRDRLFHMTAEEYALTYAEAHGVNVVISNPPFGERCGRIELGERARDLHLPAVKYFESYFLHLACELADTSMIFILPDSYAGKPEACETFQHLASRGWTLFRLRALPIDGFENAVVNTTLWHLCRAHQVDDWVDRAMDTVQKHAARPLLGDADTGTLQGAHGPVTGTLMPKGSKAQLLNQVFTGTDCYKGEWTHRAQPRWTPKPAQLGDLWRRAGKMYELTEHGWEPANQAGWMNGEPATDAFDLARVAFFMLQQNATHCARALAADLDLPQLIQQHQGIADASFLSLLQQGRMDDPVTADLQQLGILTLPDGNPFPIVPPVQQVGNLAVLPEKLTLAQRCELFLEHGDAMPEGLRMDLVETLQSQTIPVHQCRYRAPWLPRHLVGDWLGISMTHDGLFYDNSVSMTDPALIAYLNNGDRQRIDAAAEQVYETSCLFFCISVNNWSDWRMKDLRLTIHAHYHAAHGRSRLAQAVTPPPCKIVPHGYQLQDLGFALSGQGILSWDVGLGKTIGGILAAMTHPGPALIVVPKSVLAKWYRTIFTCYPNAKVAVLGFQPKPGRSNFPKDRTPLEQQSSAAFYGGMDMVLTTHDVANTISIDPLAVALADEQAAIDHYGQVHGRTAKRRSELFIQRAANRNFAAEGTRFTWTDLPLASMLLIVDEAHNYRSLYPMPTKGWSDKLIMCGQTTVSKCARDMLMKCDLLRQAGGKTLALTATPVTNALTDAFAMLRIFAPWVLEQRGICNVQKFIDHYCELEAKSTVTPMGQVKHGKAIVGFHNITDLKAMWTQAMITRTAAEVNLPIPKPVENMVEVPQSPAIAAFIGTQRRRLNKAIAEAEPAHIFKVMSQIHQCASFPPLVGIDENPKVVELLTRVRGYYDQGNQIIFTELIDAQQGIRNMLITAGFNAKEIAVVDGSVNVDKRLKIQDDYNSGKIRIVIGGTAASEGIDLQWLTIAIHHLSLPWHGQTIHQRNGRGVRQGNERDVVHVHYYILAGSTDTYRLATINTKTTWFNALRAAQTDDLSDNIFTDPIPDTMIAAMAADPEAALTELRKQRREREERSQYKAYLAILGTMKSFLAPKPASQTVLASLAQRLRRLNWIPDDVLDETLLRVRFGQEMMAQHWEKDQPERVFLAYRVQWVDQFKLVEDGDDVVFARSREGLYKQAVLGGFDRLGLAFPVPEVIAVEPVAPVIDVAPVQVVTIEEPVQPVKPLPIKVSQDKPAQSVGKKPSKPDRNKKRNDKWEKRWVQMSLF